MPGSRCVVYGCEKYADKKRNFATQDSDTSKQANKVVEIFTDSPQKFMILSHKLDMSTAHTISKSTALKEALISKEVNELLYQVQCQPFKIKFRKSGFFQ